MTELQPASVPGPNVWKRIANQLDTAVSTVKTGAPDVAALQQLLSRLRRSLGLWRGAALATGLATVAAVGVGLKLGQQVDQQDQALARATQQNAQLQAQVQNASTIEYVAVLSDDKAAASMLVTFDPRKNSLTVKQVGGYQTAADRSLQLWALPAAGPRSLGVLGEGKVVRLTATETAVKEVPALAISLEPKGGVPSETGPTGPVLFKGALIQTVL